MESCNIAAPLARVAELVDAADSKSAVRKDVSVRLRSRARFKTLVINCRGFIFLVEFNSQLIHLYGKNRTH